MVGRLFVTVNKDRSEGWTDGGTGRPGGARGSGKRGFGSCVLMCSDALSSEVHAHAHVHVHVHVHVI